MTTWTITIDWDRDGDYSGADDVTSYVLAADWFLGMRQPFQDDADDSMLRLVLDNSDRRFSPENAAGPLYGKLAPFRPVRIQSNDGATTRTHWVGWVETLTPSINVYGERRATLTAAGPMQFFKAAETALALQESQRTDAIITRLIHEVVIPPALTRGWVLGMMGYGGLGVGTYLAETTAYSALEQGVVTLALAGDNWVQQGGEGRDTFNVYRAIADVTAAERGRFLFDREGKALFWNRLHLQDEIPSALTLDDSMTDLRYDYGGLNDLKNEVVVTCHPRAVGASADEVLWELTNAVRIAAGKTQTIIVKYQEDYSSSVRIGGKDVTLADVAFSKGSAAVTLEAKANSATLTVTNAGSDEAVLSACKVKGRKIVDRGQMEAKAQDTASIATYGRRSLKLNLPSVDDLTYAQAIADYEVGRRGNPRGRVRQVTLVSHALQGGGLHAQQLACTLGDGVTISETQTGHAGKRYVIIGEQHRLTDGATRLETTWFLEPTADWLFEPPLENPAFPWKLDIEGRSRVETQTRLAF